MRETALEAVPDAITEVDVPVMLSPSRLLVAESCSLRACLAASSMVLPKHPRALLGSALHATMQYLEDRAPTWEAVESEFERHCAELLQAEGMSQEPLRDIVGFDTWNSVTTRLRQWFDDLPLDRPARRAPPAARASTAPAALVGKEVWLESSSLRLRGRVDQIEISDAGEIVVIDYKSGPVEDGRGVLKPEYVRQVMLYALLVRQVVSSMPIRVVISGLERHEIEFSEDDERETRSWLIDMLEQLPVGTNDAATMATPGPACRWCRARPHCSAYSTSAPNLWKSTIDYVLPYDCWGDVVEADVGTRTMIVRHEGGVMFRVEDVPEAALVCRRVAFFALVSREVGRLGRHPRNYQFDRRFGSAAYAM